MGLPILSRLFARDARNVFFGLLLSETSGVAYAFEQLAKDIEILREQEFNYSKSFDGILDDVDIMLSKFEKTLHQRFKKVIFIIPASGLKEGAHEVVQPYRGIISEIVRNLDLEAMGYIETIDIFKDKLSEHDSALYIEAGREKTSMILMRGGERAKHITVSTHPANVISHVSELVAKGTNIYLYPTHPSIEVQNFISELSDYPTHQYEKQEFGVGLLGLLRLQLIPKDMTSTDPIVESIQSSITDDDSALVIDSQQTIVNSENDSSAPTREEMRVVGENMVRTSDSDSIEGFKVYRKESRVDTSDHREFVIGSPAENTQTLGVVESEPTVDEDSLIIDDTQGADEEIQKPKKTQSPWRSLLMSTFTLVIIFIVGALAFEIFLHKVTIEITIPTETLSVNQALSNLPVSKSVEDKDIKVSLGTTGTRQVGERAKGKVIFASFDDKQASFSAGTKLALEDSVYQLDADVELEAASVDTTSGTKTASKQTVSASATFIGTEGNIDKGKQFNVGEYPKSLYYAISEGSFAGGSRRTVSVVSGRDLEKLKSMVTEKAKQASESARLGTSEDVVTLDGISSVDIDDLEFSASLGEVASSIEATGVVQAKLYTIAKSNILQEIGVILRKEKGEGYRINTDSLHYTFSDPKLSDKEDMVNLSLKAEVPIYKSIETQKVKGQIQLHLKDSATNILQKQYGDVGVEYVFSPNLSLYGMYIPYMLNNITIEIVPSSKSPDAE